MKKPITIQIIVPITRRWGWDIVKRNLEQLDMRGTNIKILFYLDSNDLSLYDDIANASQPLLKLKKQIKHIQIVMSKNQPPLEHKVSYRRNRIVAMKQDTVKYVEYVDYIFSFEDDTLIPSNALQKMLKTMKYDPRIGFVQGIECGRWDLPMLGVWKVDNIHDPTTIYTLPMQDGQGYVDAGGFYCYMTKPILYCQIPYHWHDECFGPDVCFGLDIRAKGLLCLTDFSIQCGHVVKTKDSQQVLYPTGQEKQLTWMKKGSDWVRDFSYIELKGPQYPVLNDFGFTKPKTQNKREANKQ